MQQQAFLRQQTLTYMSYSNSWRLLQANHFTLSELCTSRNQIFQAQGSFKITTLQKLIYINLKALITDKHAGGMYYRHTDLY
jgi:hypothetical protein